MDDASDAVLAAVIGEIAENPFDIQLHAKHLRLSQSDIDAKNGAIDMLTSFLAAPESVWLEAFTAKFDAMDHELYADVEQYLAMFERAEGDYLSIPILQNHMQYIIERHAHYTAEPKPDEFGDVFSTEWCMTMLSEIAAKGAGHLSKSHVLWDAWKDWYLGVIDSAHTSERLAMVDQAQVMFMKRLEQPHSASEETLQAYSSFATKYKAQHEYESMLVAASKMRAKAVRGYARRETLELSLVRVANDLDSYNNFCVYERRAKYLDRLVLVGIHERAIAEAARRLFEGQPGAEEALRSFWTGLCDSLRKIHLRGHDAGLDDLDILAVYGRAVRSVPGCGEIWARYIRFLVDGVCFYLYSILVRAEIYGKAMQVPALTSDPEQIIPVVLARADYDRHRLIDAEGNADTIVSLISNLEAGIELVRKAPGDGDTRLRLERQLAEIYTTYASLPDAAIGVWRAATEHHRRSYLAWTSYTDILIKNDQIDEARSVFTSVHYKQLDWPEAIWEAWLAFEHLHGSLETIEACIEKVGKAREQTNARRAKQATRAAMQYAAEQQASVPVAAAPVPAPEQQEEDRAQSESMDVGKPQPARPNKREAEETPGPSSRKKAKLESNPPPLKRDRENCTVFVADLPADTAEDELRRLFKDCGELREIKITSVTNNLVATVEFNDRDSVPAALTKDKKRIHGQEVAVHLAWKSTLYVTNFPAAYDDAAVRGLFGQYGTLFDVRWPSKKFKSTRRFCYVQFTNPTSAERALELHGQELEPGLQLNVFISNPTRKKERTDHDAAERELYVAGLSKFTTKADLEKLFSAYGPIKEVRMATDKDGNSRGFAFVEFEDEKFAAAGLNANNHELKKRRIAVTLANAHVRSRQNVQSDTGLGRKAELRSRSVQLSNIPAGVQEGLLQQALVKIAPVKRVELVAAEGKAVVEFESTAEAGKFLLRTEPIVFHGNTLEASGITEGSSSRPVAPSTKTDGLFVPRSAASRPRAGLGHTRKAPSARAPTIVAGSSSTEMQTDQTTTPAQGKEQDDFRKMLGV
ncbi:hypothetical protein FISHEDRAFT_50684 [Fistulina hepatica ATCC 64428]|uniref:U4/U6 snRNA-associated-splicing factor PRP24 n=1 Tax=Fistulina hepatica ATCC 64428 TaxID=1128425 RepID=A0A0D7A314_9AGAR|nr:hypothetical protein FISHEDRAFT_50684 [Fistulina hepatica ATCC 64428]